MPVFLLQLFGGLTALVGPVVARIIVALGISYITYQGLDAGVAYLKTQVLVNLVNNYPEINAALSMLKIGEAINVTFSAIVARNLLEGMTNGNITKGVIK